MVQLIMKYLESKYERTRRRFLQMGWISNRTIRLCTAIYYTNPHEYLKRENQFCKLDILHHACFTLKSEGGGWTAANSPTLIFWLMASEVFFLWKIYRLLPSTQCRHYSLHFSAHFLHHQPIPVVWELWEWLEVEVGFSAPSMGSLFLCDWFFYCKIISKNDKKNVFDVSYSG